MRESHCRSVGLEIAQTSAILVVIKAELRFGVELSPRKRRDAAALAAFLLHMEVLDFPDEAATHYAGIRADLHRRGQMIGAYDLFIAAHARCLGLILVTNNTAEFGRVKKLYTENWTLLPPPDGDQAA